ncbi:hypothetical protein QOT17_021709 [Balamuthia mandrillaris]
MREGLTVHYGHGRDEKEAYVQAAFRHLCRKLAKNKHYPWEGKDYAVHYVPWVDPKEDEDLDLDLLHNYPVAQQRCYCVYEALEVCLEESARNRLLSKLYYCTILYEDEDEDEEEAAFGGPPSSTHNGNDYYINLLISTTPTLTYSFNVNQD